MDKYKELQKLNSALKLFTRIDADVNGNPRYYLPAYSISDLDRVELLRSRLAITSYNGKQYGKGYVFQTYNLRDDARELLRVHSLSDYEVQGELFLVRAGASITIEKAVPQRSPRWATDGKHGTHYAVTITTTRGTYTFDYWGSIADKEKGEEPSAYDVLACLDGYKPDTFADFCANYGYSDDSITALKVYEGVREQYENLARIFTRKQLKDLSEIL